MWGMPNARESLGSKVSVWLGRWWIALAGDVVPIREQKAWTRSRFDQARLSRAEWPNTHPWSFSGVSGVTGVAVGFVGAVFAGPFGGILGLTAGLVLLWFTSWLWFAVKAPSVALSAARSEITQQRGEITELSAGRDEMRKERDDAHGELAARPKTVVLEHKFPDPPNLSQEVLQLLMRTALAEASEFSEESGRG